MSQGNTYILLTSMQVSTHGGIPPKRATHGAAGYDLYTPEGFTIQPGESVIIDLKIKLHIPGGYYGKIESRSGLGFRHGIIAFGGVIDSDYRGTVKIKLFHLGQEPLTVAPGDRVAQMVLNPHASFLVVPVAAVAPTARGEAGFGSTGT